MKNIDNKFKSLIRRLNYSQIRLEDINSEAFKDWSYHNIPKVVEQLEDLGWKLDADATWDETVFINNVVSMYGTRIGVYVTNSYLDYKLASGVLATKEFKNLRKAFKFNYHLILLVDPIIFLQEEDLDIIYQSLPTDIDYLSLDLSHYDDKDNLEEDYKVEWGWLEYEGKEKEEDTEDDVLLWTSTNIDAIYNSEYHTYTANG